MGLLSNLTGQRVQVYRNLKATAETGPWSIRQNGLVIGYSDNICLKQVLFHVNPKAQARIAAGADRQVHAWATGIVISPAPNCPMPLHYRPHEGPNFFDSGGQPIYTARFAHFHQPPGSEKPGCFILSSNG